jgi:hypothetical protein
MTRDRSRCDGELELAAPACDAAQLERRAWLLVVDAVRRAGGRGD